MNTDSNQTKFIKVASITFDDLILLLKVKKALLKIDMETMHCLAFQNGDKIFSEIDIPAIIMKIGESGLQYSSCFESTLKFLNNRNYIAFYFDTHSNQQQPLNFTNWKDWDFKRSVYFKKIILSYYF